MHHVRGWSILVHHVRGWSILVHHVDQYLAGMYAVLINLNMHTKCPHCNEIV